MLAERFAQVRNGKIVAIVEATPPQELVEGQFPLSRLEWDLLHYLPLLPDGKGIDLIGSIEMINKCISRIKDMENE